jgi:hypothetical protein
VTSLVVFLGPSLDRDRAERTLGATFLPPIKRGDIDALLTAPGPVPAAIGIIDGQFFQRLAISPKEVLRALDAGVRVFGASSMGALRAAELASFGMVGVGDVYRLYAQGVIDADDEVALTYNSETLEPLSAPLVNMRLALRAAVARGLTTAEFADAFIATAQALYYPDRSYRRVFQSLGSTPAEPLTRFLSSQDAKRDDAIELLTQLRHYLSPAAEAGAG